MKVRKIQFDYEIIAANVMEGTFEILYTPADETLAPIRRNTSLFFLDVADTEFATQDEIPIRRHIDYTIESCAPYAEWARQKAFTQLAEQLVGLSGTKNAPSED